MRGAEDIIRDLMQALADAYFANGREDSDAYLKDPAYIAAKAWLEAPEQKEDPEAE
jgi:hypothetical protein